MGHPGRGCEEPGEGPGGGLQSTSRGTAAEEVHGEWVVRVNKTFVSVELKPQPGLPRSLSAPGTLGGCRRQELCIDDIVKPRVCHVSNGRSSQTGDNSSTRASSLEDLDTCEADLVGSQVPPVPEPNDDDAEAALPPEEAAAAPPKKVSKTMKRNQRRRALKASSVGKQQAGTKPDECVPAPETMAAPLEASPLPASPPKTAGEPMPEPGGRAAAGAAGPTEKDGAAAPLATIIGGGRKGAAPQLKVKLSERRMLKEQVFREIRHLETGNSSGSADAPPGGDRDAALPRDYRESVGTITAKQLARYSGDNKRKRLLVSIYGDIFDVSADRSVYGHGAPRESWAGKDITWALAAGSQPDQLNTFHDVFKSPDGPVYWLTIFCRWLSHYENLYGRPVGRLDVYDKEEELPPPRRAETAECAVQ